MLTTCFSVPENRIAAVAKPNPDRGDKRAAQAECKALRGHTAATHEAFRALQKSFVACVKAKSADEAQEEQSAHKNAAKECKAEGLKGREYGKCVSTKAKAKKAAADKEDKAEEGDRINAAKSCKTAKKDTAAFAAKWGTKRNAFGKCVSATAKENAAERKAEAAPTA